jgi:hypothetical protein
MRRRHAEHFLGLAEEAAKVAYGGEQAEWWGRLDADHDNERGRSRGQPRTSERRSYDW